MNTIPKRLYVSIATSNALESLEQLCIRKVDNSDKSILMDKAFQIYNQMNESKNANVINTMLKVCLRFNALDQSKSIWTDVKQLSSMQQHSESDHHQMMTSYLLFLKCSTKTSANIDMDRCIEVLQLIRDCGCPLTHEYDIRDYSMSISCMIKQCHNMDKIHKIYSLLIEEDIYIATALINAFGASGDIEIALKIFSGMSETKKDSVVMNALMKWLIKCNQADAAMLVYDQYEWLQDDVSHILVLKVCGVDKADHITQQLEHDSDMNLKNALIDYYGQCGDIKTALTLFNAADRDVISVGSIIQCLVKNEHYEEALTIYEEYHQYSLCDDQSHTLAIKACTYCNLFEKGKQIRSRIKIQNDPCAAATLIDFYGAFGSIWRAQRIFERIPWRRRDLYVITAMMDAYCKAEMNRECLDLFGSVRKPDLVCYTIALKACAQGTAYHFGKKLHDKLGCDKEMFHRPEIEAGLINFYGKCGELRACDVIFERSVNRNHDVLLWNAMMNAYGRNGNASKAKQILFNCLQQAIQPDIHSFIFLINACGHSGQSEDVKDATVIWNTAIHEDHIKYNPYVITSLCDCLARYGKLQHAKQLIKEYEEHHSHQRKCIHYPMYMALFSGYCKKGDERMAQQVHKEMQSKFTDYQMKAPSVMLSNMHYQITNDTNFTNL